MSHEPAKLDLAQAHRHFAGECFNRTWSLIDKPDRTAADDEAMVLCATASLWHWTQRTECTNQNLSIGHWQLSRVYALIGQGENALRNARRSLDFSQDSPPFYIGYAHEAVARAAVLVQDSALLQRHLAAARECIAALDDPADRAPLEQDLAAIEAQNAAAVSD